MYNDDGVKNDELLLNDNNASVVVSGDRTTLTSDRLSIASQGRGVIVVDTDAVVDTNGPEKVMLGATKVGRVNAIVNEKLELLLSDRNGGVSDT